MPDLNKSYHDILKSYGDDKVYSSTAGGIGVGTVTSGGSISMVANTGKLKGIPIPTYHCVDDTIFGYAPIFVSPVTFEVQMKHLKDKGYTGITFQDFGNLDKIDKPILITLDDGYEDNYVNAYPILKKYGFKATIFLISGAIGASRHLSLQEIDKMKDIIDFQSHTVTHQHLAEMTLQQMDTELSQSKKTLEAMLGKKIDVIAYPYGSYDERVLAVAKKYYSFGVTTNFGEFYQNQGDDYQIKRIGIIATTKFSDFVNLFK